MATSREADLTSSQLSPRVKELISKFTAQPDPTFVAQICNAMKRCVAAVNDGVGDPKQSLSELEKLTGKEWQEETFFEIWGWTSEEELAEAAAIDFPEPLSDMSETELAQIVDFHRSNGGQIWEDRLFEYLEASLPTAFSTDLLFWPYRDMTPFEVAQEVTKRKKILGQSGLRGLREYELKLAQMVLENPKAKPYSRQWAKGILRSRRKNHD
ncbi:hypothetical protein [Parasphingopyxis sp.]|uniref:hypothetical protein n=1 Tax=Parasphingopyxis sp. TaxID=1920299 RepID=UPI002636529B|nr:hypothetical protein [Parasphingopyxis sp.]